MFAFFKGELDEARKSLKVFFLQPNLLLNILWKVSLYLQWENISKGFLMFCKLISKLSGHCLESYKRAYTCRINSAWLHEIRYKKKKTLNTITTQAYHSGFSSWKQSSKAKITWDFKFSPLFRIKQVEFESKHWFPCGVNGRSLSRSGNVRSRDYLIFLGWVDLFSHRAPKRFLHRGNSTLDRTVQLRQSSRFMCSMHGNNGLWAKTFGKTLCSFNFQNHPFWLLPKKRHVQCELSSEWMNTTR